MDIYTVIWNDFEIDELTTTFSKLNGAVRFIQANIYDQYPDKVDDVILETPEDGYGPVIFHLCNEFTILMEKQELMLENQPENTTAEVQH